MGFESNANNQIERTLLELGTEVYRLKTEIGEMKSFHENFIDIVNGLKYILDEKGVITLEDFDAAVELGDAISFAQTHKDPNLEDEMKKIKKSSH